ncbi:MAG: MFS transporter [Bacteroidia bacterium]|nr:MFS transporter [Bacteroidia bacterium]MCZ2277650.1 MFS transporter [Bacteroidia bacterium]
MPGEQIITIKRNDKRTINAWAMYDWANSVYSLVITSAIFPVYYSTVTMTNGDDTVRMFGRTYTNTALYSYSLSASFLVIAFLSPMLAGIADYRGIKKAFMQFFCFLGSASCAFLFFFTGKENLWIGILGFFLASIGWAGSIVFYNAFLPEIADKEHHDAVSARGFAMGYTGSSLLLIFNLIMIMQPGLFGIQDGSLPARISFLLVGTWWAGFAFYTFKYLPARTRKKYSNGNVLFKGFHELKNVLTQIRKHKVLPVFLLSFFFYNMGVQTVMYVAALFGDKELQLDSSQLIITILIIQFVAIGGAYLFSGLSYRMGNFRALITAICVWIVICIAAYYTTTSMQFYTIAFLVGLVMGGIQSLSRSTYSKLLPDTHDTASYFSLYDICEKIGLVIGTASYGLIEELTGSMRNSVIALILFFILGLILVYSASILRRKELKTHRISTK